SLLGKTRTWQFAGSEAPSERTQSFSVVNRGLYPIRYLAYLNDSHWLAGTPKDNTTCVAVWDAETGQEMERSPAGSGPVFTLATDIEQRWMVAATPTGDSRLQIGW